MSETDETTAMVAEQNTRGPQREPSPATSLRRRLPMRLIAAFVVALAGLVLVGVPGTYLLDGRAGIWGKALAFGGTLLFVAGGVTATRIVAAHVERNFVLRRLGAAVPDHWVMIVTIVSWVVALAALRF